jgi:hypothetical protein
MMMDRNHWTVAIGEREKRRKSPKRQQKYAGMIMLLSLAQCIRLTNSLKLHHRGFVFLHDADGLLDATTLKEMMNFTNETDETFRRRFLVDNTIASDNPLANPHHALAARALAHLAERHLGGSGSELWKPAKHSNRLVHDDRGHKHVRVEQHLYQDKYPIVNAAMVVHMDDQQSVYAVNGEFVADGSVDTRILMTCEEAFESLITRSEYRNAVYKSNACEVKVVLDTFGAAHLAWERLLEYQETAHRDRVGVNDRVFSSHQRVLIYVSTITGAVVARRPRSSGLAGEGHYQTRDCHNQRNTSRCTLVTNATGTTMTRDLAARYAHNHARRCYLFYLNQFGRRGWDDSADDASRLPIVADVHYGSKFNDAGWDEGSNSIFFGDGDGMCERRKRQF